MDDVTASEIATVFIRSWSSDSRAEDSWANDQLDQLVRKNPEGAWGVILRVLAMAPPTVVLSILAAGPLEDLLCDHGLAFVERVEKEAQQNAILRECLSYVWGETRMNSDVYNVIHAIKARSEPLSPG